MCGLVGVLRIGNSDCTAELRSAMAAIAHRGPDDAGHTSQVIDRNGATYVLGLGHLRLSIFDLSSAGHQPMVDEGGRVIVFNGEIYNFLELKQELTGLGHRFRTKTDTEVLLAAYEQWGEASVERLIGMWAIAIWDGDRLFLSRDRLGKKPLYYHHNPDVGLLVFASEIKALRAITGVPWKPDELTVYRFLAFAEQERDERTFYEEIRELPAASWLSYRPGDQAITPHAYWRLVEEELDIGEPEAIARTSELLHDSLRLRLRSDAPLGLSLSGGLDSTLLLALMNEADNGPPKAFSSRYSEPGYNESQYVEIARRGLRCQAYDAFGGPQLFAEEFERFIRHLDQPCKLPGPYSQWRVVALARGHVKVLLDGQGADELAGGYVYFLPQAWRETPIIDKLRYLPDMLLTAWGNRHLFRQYAPAQLWERIRGYANAETAGHVLTPWARQYEGVRPGWETSGKPGLQSWLRESLIASSLPALLRYSDRVTMAFGVENRCPFLDHRLVEFVNRLPINMKIRGGTTKWIFRAIAKARVPAAIVNRRMKMGFPTPVGVWLRGELAHTARKWIEEYFCREHMRRWLDKQVVNRAVDEHIAGKQEHQALLWRVLAVGAWLKTAEIE